MRLTAEEREALTKALYDSKIGEYGYLGRPECEQFTEPLVPAVEGIVAARMAAVEALADEWADEGPSLVRNAYSGGDVHEGLTLERCAAALRAALGGAVAGEAGE